PASTTYGKSHSGDPSERTTGALPASAAHTASGTSREPLVSPPPYRFANRVTATGSPNVCQYERATMSAEALEASYGNRAASGWSSRYGSSSWGPYALSEEA